MVIINEVDITKKQLDRIGVAIKDDTVTKEELKIVSDYRSKHSQLIKSLYDIIRSNSIIKKRNNILISRRLKRMSSIIRKLKRFDKMKLSSMQDLGGVRVIFDNIKDLYEFSNILKNKTYPLSSKNKNNFIFVKEKDYIENVKDDGYRSVHQIYKYKGSILELKDYKIELQLRTKIQHQWSTAVEIMDLIENTALKFGEKSGNYNQFFILCSKLLENLEEKKYTKEEINSIIEELKELGVYKILDKLVALTVRKRNFYLKDEKGSLLIVLDLKERKIEYIKASDEKSLEIQYKLLELEYLNDSNKDVVLVSLPNLTKLEKSYPNYFLDAKGFVEQIRKIIN